MIARNMTDLRTLLNWKCPENNRHSARWLERSTCYTFTIVSIQVCLQDIFHMKVDHHSYRRNFCSCEKKAWKRFRLVWDSKVASITASITAIIYFHIILHLAVHIYVFYIFITSGYFFLIILPIPLKVNWCQRLLIFFFLA